MEQVWTNLNDLSILKSLSSGLFDGTHHVEIGTANSGSYRDIFINCSNYVTRVSRVGPEAIFISIIQEPSAWRRRVSGSFSPSGATRQILNNHSQETPYGEMNPENGTT